MARVHRLLLARGWALGICLAGLGLTALWALPGTDDLNRGLAFRPVANITGGLVIGAGMVVARSCVSGLFYKLGSGMLGAVVGLAGWALGELSVRSLDVPGPTVLSGGEDATVPGVLGLPRLVVVAVLLLGVGAWAWRRDRTRPEHPWQWGSRAIGVGLAVAITAGWALAAAGDSSFGPSSVGAANSIAAGSPNEWLITFLLGIVAGGFLAARTAGGWWVRGEQPVRYVQLFGGGLLLGAGGWIAGGCNLGHGLSGAAQLNVSSFAVVGAMVVGVAATRRLTRSASERVRG